MADKPILYDYWRSSASYRVRIALNLAGIDYETVEVNLLEKAHKSDAHMQRNPQGLVPVLDIDGHRFTQSLAILEYLDTTRSLGLLPQEPARRARVQALAHCIAVDVHPVCNLSVVARFAGSQPDPEKARFEWMQAFIAPGLAAFEKMLGDFEQAPYCTGDTVAVSDVCLMPQIYNADRWDVDYKGLKRIMKVVRSCAELPAFDRAHPENTPR